MYVKSIYAIACWVEYWCWFLLKEICLRLREFKIKFKAKHFAIKCTNHLDFADIFRSLTWSIFARICILAYCRFKRIQVCLMNFNNVTRTDWLNAICNPVLCYVNFQFIIIFIGVDSVIQDQLCKEQYAGLDCFISVNSNQHF